MIDPSVAPTCLDLWLALGESTMYMRCKLLDAVKLAILCPLCRPGTHTALTLGPMGG